MASAPAGHEGLVPNVEPGGTVLEVRDLVTRFHTSQGVVRAVNGISYSLAAGESLAIVGESGSGKSVGALSLMGLVMTALVVLPLVLLIRPRRD